MELTLPWPPSALSPNARVHWAAKAKAAKTYRHDCYIVCRMADIVPPATCGKLLVTLAFHPPRNGRHDIDNCLARAKSGIDGISDYLGIDDCMFNYKISMQDKIIGGCIKIRIGAND